MCFSVAAWYRARVNVEQRLVPAKGDVDQVPDADLHGASTNARCWSTQSGGVRRRHHQHSVDSLQGAPQGIGVPNGPGAAVAPGGGGPRAGSRTTSVWDLLLQPVGGPRCGRRGFRWLRSLLSRGRTRVSVANHHILFESSGICVIPRRRVKATPRRSFWQKMTAASFTASSSTRSRVRWFGRKVTTLPGP